ncbi:unnamed protein product [marine sediment metagenome]|uniref:Uncharacterized protein n=1 Tax=marine sediment metagenome TaxID=412755 RepID=X1TDL2_9ZZZZ
MGEYFGYGPSHINGLGFRTKGERPVTFSKSVLNEEEEYYFDEYGVKRRKKGITELQDIDVEEVSFVDSPVVRKKFMIIKGDDKKVDRCEWTTVQNQIFGYTEDDLAMVNDEDIEIEKSSPDDKWPSLSRQFNLNKQRLERTYEEYAVAERLV